jgi:transcriptional regulator with XRE-family HTH domain
LKSSLPDQPPRIENTSVPSPKIVRSLARRRRRLNLSQTDVAARMGTSQSALARLESGDLDPRLSTVERFATAVQGELVQDIGGGAPPPAGLVDAADLETWASRLSAQSELPAIVRRLISATSGGVRRLDFPAEEGVQHGGWDGVVEVDRGNHYVPAGRSLWELGTSQDIKKKADADYKHRSKNPLGEDTSKCSFVFVTPRRWRARLSKTAWEAQRKAEGIWQDVRVIDADDLAAWLELAPPVHYWLSERLGKLPRGARPLEAWWKDWCSPTSPRITPALVVSGRREVEDLLSNHLRNEPGVIFIRADSREEALAFTAAVIERLPAPEREAMFTRALVIFDESAWRHAISSSGPGLLIPAFDGVSVSAEAARRHSIVVPVGRHLSPRSGVTHLPRLNRAEAESALEQMLPRNPKNPDLPREQAREFASVAARSLLALRRRLSLRLELKQPAWASPENAGRLVPFCLAGAWNSAQEGDRTVLSRLANRPYDDLDRDLTRWANESDPPVRRIGDIWYLSDREDAWSLLISHATDGDLQRFEGTALEVLGTALPAMSLPIKDRWQANVLGFGSPISSQLREGLAQSLALLGARSGTAPAVIEGTAPQTRANRVVRELIRRCATDSSGGLWSSISDLLPLMAEAAPATFLEELEEAVTAESFAPRVFQDGDDVGPLFHSSPHTGLLWALEGLAWSDEFLARAVLVLGFLARIDPGGSLSNRPSRSLREILLPWFPQTSANAATRLLVMDTLCEREPSVGWELLLSLLPNHHDVVTMTHRPRWREWTTFERTAVTYEELWSTERRIVDHLVIMAGHDGGRWANLAKTVSYLSDKPREEVLHKLLSLNATELNDEGHVLANALRETIAHHRKYPAADWAMEPSFVDRLEEAYQHIRPSDPVTNSAWLFTDYPDVVDPNHDGTDPDADWKAHEQVITDARCRAANEVYDAQGLAGIRRLAALAERPFHLGFALGTTGIPQADEAELLNSVGSDEAADNQLAAGYVGGRFAADGWTWADIVLEDATDRWAPHQTAQFLACITDPLSWAWLDRSGLDVQREYWARVHTFVVMRINPIEGATRFCERGRPFDALDVLAMEVHSGKTDFDLELAFRILESCAQTAPPNWFNGTMFSYHVSQILDLLERRGADRQRLMKAELTYVPILKHERQPKLIYDEMSRDPAFFVEILTWVFKAEGDDPREATDELRSRAEVGYELLHSWKIVPGSKADGTIDTDLLSEWIVDARRLCAERGRPTLGDQYIGHILRYVPEQDDVWPPDDIAKIIDSLANREIERGLEVEVYNSRGFTSRGLSDGGAQERVLAAKYLGWAENMDNRRPRTAALLRRIADGYDEDAEREDREARLHEEHGW